MGQEGPSVPWHMVHLNNDMIYDIRVTNMKPYDYLKLKTIGAPSAPQKRWRTVGLGFFAACSSAAAYSRTPTPLDRGLIQRPKAGKVWFGFVDARGRSL